MRRVIRPVSVLRSDCQSLCYGWPSECPSRACLWPRLAPVAVFLRDCNTHRPVLLRSGCAGGVADVVASVSIPAGANGRVSPPIHGHGLVPWPSLSAPAPGPVPASSSFCPARPRQGGHPQVLSPATAPRRGRAFPPLPPSPNPPYPRCRAGVGALDTMGTRNCIAPDQSRLLHGPDTQRRLGFARAVRCLRNRLDHPSHAALGSVALQAVTAELQTLRYRRGLSALLISGADWQFGRRLVRHRSCPYWALETSMGRRASHRKELEEGVGSAYCREARA